MEKYAGKENRTLAERAMYFHLLYNENRYLEELYDARDMVR